MGFYHHEKVDGDYTSLFFQNKKLNEQGPLIDILYLLIFTTRGYVHIILWVCFTTVKAELTQGYNARKVNCSCVYSAYILKPVLSGRFL